MGILGIFRWKGRKEGKREEGKKSIEEEVDERIATIKEDVEGLRACINNLLHVSFEGGKREYSAINMVKDNFVRSALLAMNVRMPDKERYSEIKKFLEDVEGMVSSIKNTSLKSAYVLTRYFKEEGKGIAEYLKLIEKHTLEFRDFLERNNVLLKEGEREKRERKMRIEEEVKEINEEILRLEKGIVEIKKEAERIRNRMEEIKKSSGYVECNKNKKRLVEIKNEKMRLSSEFISLFSPVMKEVKKIRHELKKEGKLTHDLKEVMDSIVQGRSDAIETASTDALELLGDVYPSDENKDEFLSMIKRGVEKIRKFRELVEEENRLVKAVNSCKEERELKNMEILLEDKKYEIKRMKEMIEENMRKKDEMRREINTLSSPS